MQLRPSHLQIAFERMFPFTKSDDFRLVTRFEKSACQLSTQDHV